MEWERDHADEVKDDQNEINDHDESKENEGQDSKMRKTEGSNKGIENKRRRIHHKQNWSIHLGIC